MYPRDSVPKSHTPLLGCLPRTWGKCVNHLHSGWIGPQSWCIWRCREVVYGRPGAAEPVLAIGGDPISNVLIGSEGSLIWPVQMEMPICCPRLKIQNAKPPSEESGVDAKAIADFQYNHRLKSSQTPRTTPFTEGTKQGWSTEHHSSLTYQACLIFEKDFISPHVH